MRMLPSGRSSVHEPAFWYDAAGLIDPFRPHIVTMASTANSRYGGGLQPTNRLKGAAESYPLESISCRLIDEERPDLRHSPNDGALHQVRAAGLHGPELRNYHQDYRDGNEFARAGTGSDRRLG